MSDAVLSHSRVDVARAGIESLLFPRSAAIVGATPRNPELIAGALRFPGAVWGVHPVRRDVLGLECRPSVSELPEVPEVAVLLVGHQRIGEAFEDAAAAGVRAFIVPGLGSEAGAEGRVIAASLAARADELGAAVLGPNCMGAATPHRGSLWLGTVPDTFLPGSVSVIA